MPKAPSPWNRDCRRQQTDFSSDDPGLALTPQRDRETNLLGAGDEGEPRSTAVALALALGVGAVIAVIVMAVIATLSNSGAGA